MAHNLLNREWARKTRQDRVRVAFMKGSSWLTDGLHASPERFDVWLRKLARGILLQAFRDALKETRELEEDVWQRDALDWFFSDLDDPGSLRWVCGILNLRPWGIRRWFQSYRRCRGEGRRKMSRELLLSFRSQF